MLSQEQEQALLSKTRNNWSQADISAFLTQECGLSLRDAATKRHWAIEIIQHEKNQQAQEAAQRDPREEERRKREEAEAHARRKEEVERERLAKCNPSYLPDEAHEERECVTCGDPHFWCDCTCKRFSDIPF